MSPPTHPPSELLLVASRLLAAETERLRFAAPVTHVYNPLVYARAAHEAYVLRFARTQKRVVFVGMNPGPWGMAQTGVPFGEVSMVRDWMGIEAPVDEPPNPHPKRPIDGFACRRSEVSGQRLWGLMRERFGEAERFFAEHFVANYCPLVFMESSARNRTPDKLPAAESEPLYAACDRHLAAVIDALRPRWLIGIGKFAAERASAVVAQLGVRSADAPAAAAARKGPGSRRTAAPPTPLPIVGSILHPSPANPQANRGWERIVSEQLRELGVWK